jgi:uncharacterized protein YbbK (DUF523 family)
MKKKVLISACLLGKNCRYNGEHAHQKELDRLDVDWIPVCPEEAGNLGTPRPAAEMQASAENILNGRGNIITNTGSDVTKKIIEGAEKSLIKGINSGVEYAILKSRSPSCGIGKVYDGTFSHSLKDGNGIFAHLCSKSKIHCISSDEPNKIKKTLKKLK